MTKQSRDDRKDINDIFALNVKNIATGDVYFSRAEIIDISPTGLLLKVKREDILSHALRSTLTLSGIHGVGVGFTIEVMDTYIEGEITRTKPEGKGDFLAAVDFRDDAPEYWRNALYDLLPDGDGIPSGDPDAETDPDVDADDLDDDLDSETDPDVDPDTDPDADTDSDSGSDSDA